MIPLILGAVALGTAVFGVGASVAGVADMNQAKEIGERAQERYEDAVSNLKADWKVTDQLALEYDQLRRNVKLRTIGQFVDFIKRNLGQRASQQDLEFLTQIGILEECEALALEAEQLQFFKAGAKAVVGGAAVGQGAVGLAGMGVAGTGSAISGLSGAAAWNATLAWLGGGSLASGGGGMALGTLVLGGITVGPALLVGGFVLAGKGEEALTKAREYEATVNTKVAKIEAAGAFLQRVERRLNELANLVYDLNNYAVQSLRDLESRPFDRDRDASKFQQVALLVKALEEIMKTPVLDSEGQLNPVTATIKAKYRTLAGN